jgi:hypothetical protein
MIFSSDPLWVYILVVSENVVLWKPGIFVFRAKPASPVIMIGAKFVVRQIRIFTEEFAVFRSIWGFEDGIVGILQLSLRGFQCQWSLRCLIFAEWR